MVREYEESEFVKKESCPECGSEDNLARYSDGHAHCFSQGCDYFEPATDGDAPVIRQAVSRKKHPDLLPVGEITPWIERGIDNVTAQKWGFSKTYMGDQAVRVFNYRDLTGNIIAQKVRTRDKKFFFIGDTKNAGLFGMHLWRDGGKKVVVVEGEIDAMSVSKVFNHRYAIVSIPTGASGAKKSLQKNLEWLQKFEEIILLFDQDDPGREATEECAPLFTPGTCKIAKIELKDPNEMLVNGKTEELLNAIYGAKVYRPDGIVEGIDTWDLVNEVDQEEGYRWPFKRLQEMTEGFRPGELIILTAGSGVGKSAITRETQYSLIDEQDTKTGVLMLEETTKRTARGLIGLAINKLAHKLQVWTGLALKERRLGWEKTLGTGRVFLYDHFGSTDVDNLLSKIRYMAKGCECGVIFLDHLSIVASGSEESDERKFIDLLVTKLKTLAVETGITLIGVSHLSRPKDKGHEEGAQTSLRQLRGSHAIAQLADFVIGLERNQQDETHANITTLRVLKNRFTGETGPAGWLEYSPVTGRLTELHDDPFKGKEGATNSDDPF